MGLISITQSGGDRTSLALFLFDDGFLRSGCHNGKEMFFFDVLGRLHYIV
jgi:hypothetical protein